MSDDGVGDPRRGSWGGVEDLTLPWPASDTLSLGVEEELLLVHPVTHMLVHDSARVLAGMALPKNLAHAELYAACVELASPVCTDVPEVIDSISALRRALNASGAVAVGVGTHPGAVPGDAAMLDDPRYLYVADLLGAVALRTPECGLHVHIGMPDPETGVKVLNGLRLYMPLLEALAANSPYLGGVDSGLASVRGVLLRRYPRFEIPRAFDGFEDYLGALAVAMRAAGVDDPSLVWWRLRLHPKLGTVEARVMDSQSSLFYVGALVALVHALAARAAHGVAIPSAPPEAIGESCYQAQRFGLAARLWDGEGVKPVREMVRDVLSAVRGHARELGCEEPVDGVMRIVLEGNGADRQRSTFRDGGLPAVLRALVVQTGDGQVMRRGGAALLPRDAGHQRATVA
jgi:glutamate---cysteine ligase / carboxylate-amine ligase